MANIQHRKALVKLKIVNNFNAIFLTYNNIIGPATIYYRNDPELQRRFRKRLYCVFAICVFLPP